MLILAGMMIGMLYFNWRVARSMLRYLEIRRRLPDLAHAGDWFTVELEATSSSRATAIAMEDPIQPLHAARARRCVHWLYYPKSCRANPCGLNIACSWIAAAATSSGPYGSRPGIRSD